MSQSLIELIEKAALESANKFNVSEVNVSQIVSRKSWKHNAWKF